MDRFFVAGFMTQVKKASDSKSSSGIVQLPDIGEGLKKLEKKQRPIVPWLVAGGGLGTLGGGMLIARAISQASRKAPRIASNVMKRLEGRIDLKTKEVLRQVERSTDKMVDKAIGKSMLELNKMKGEAAAAAQKWKSMGALGKLKTLFGKSK